MKNIALIQEFVAALNAKHSEYDFSVDALRKYVRVVAASPLNGDNRHVYLFVDGENNILKAAGWKSPAKGVRAVLTEDNVQEIVDGSDPYGSWLYKR